MKKILVAYFSASGVTKKVAENMASAANADLFEIMPQQPYTRADLNWMNKQSRSTLEMKDRNCRPAMATKPDVSGYDVILVGFPVWWYREPSIIDTFMERPISPERPSCRSARLAAAVLETVPLICSCSHPVQRCLTGNGFRPPLLPTN